MRWKEHFLVPDHTIKGIINVKMLMILCGQIMSLMIFQDNANDSCFEFSDISGASFAGFYYICFQKSTSCVEGYYFHRNSEWYDMMIKLVN